MARGALGWLAMLSWLAAGCGGGPSPAHDGSGTDSTTATDSDDDTADPIPDPSACAPISIPVLDTPGAQTFERVASRAEIPGLAEQPSAHGQILGTLFAFDGRLHLGYGDYSDNTGPIPATAWDPAQGAFVELGTLPTEEVLWFRPGLGTLYTPAIDPDGHEEEGGIYRLDCGAESWHVGTPIGGAVHVYDVARQGQTIYAGTGSLTGAPGLLVSSTDHGESWTEVLRHDSPAGRFSRIYFVGATSQRLFASGREHPDPQVSFAWVRDGDGDFVPLSEPPAGSLVPVVLGEELVIAAFSSNPGRGSYLGGYRIEGTGFVPHEPWPAAVEGETLVAWAPVPADEGHPERLLALMRAPDGVSRVYDTTDLAAGADGWAPWLELAALPDGEAYVSMALLLDDLYLGTNLGSLYAVRELYAPAP